MALSQRLEIRQGQALVMTPQLQQAIKLLQLSNMELSEYVEQELEKNPLLERDDSVPEVAGEARAEAPAEAGDPERLDQALNKDDFAATGDIDAGRDDLYDESRAEKQQAESEVPQVSTDWSRTGPGGGFDASDELEGALTAQQTLKDHLEAQLSIAALEPHERFIATMMIEAVDDAGYLRADLEEMREKLGAQKYEIDFVLAALQGFEPTGVFARDLAECLSLQLKARDRLDPAMQALLTRLDLVAKRDIAQLSQICGVDTADVADMIAELKTLSPKPGQGFESEPVQPVVPDVFVRESADGSWNVELNSDTLPRVLINSRYYAKVSASARTGNDKAYITDCLNNANWLVKSLDQRARTILKVASEITRQQDAFLTHGVRHLRPLNLKSIADAIGMHESTVSRVTSNKYISTPRGLFELKYFFTASIASVGGGEAHSAEAVRDRIKELVQNERGDILSDDRIVTMLSADGVNIARRTVAKYREALRIPSSVERRRLFQLEGARAAE